MKKSIAVLAALNILVFSATATLLAKLHATTSPAAAGAIAVQTKPPQAQDLVYLREHLQAANALRVNTGAAALEKVLPNPGSFRLTSALFLGDGTVCYEYLTGDATAGRAVLTLKDKLVVGNAAWAEYCSGKPGEQMVQKVRR